ncbi:MAG: ribosome maturation factor RimP [Desulfovibrio sp.]|nr:ribosome maturation factor RimP [Desulfovibrio sp.]MBQ1845124.1 ribosome maturation factor RimP [Desulfovibrio sp.]MBQ4125613.1 ribosome maturation factor RimP [Desulfovibrio sp.]MCR5169655.1 ribosome maturation factor RimP [Desulfovibrio sp.]
MSANALKDAVLALAEPAVEAEGLAVWGLEILESGRMAIRLFVDMPEPAGQNDGQEGDSDLALDEAGDGALAQISATVDQCERISRQLALALDMEDLVDRAYTLEVSSPGFNRIFFSLDQMRPYVGDMVEARMHEAWAPEGQTPRRVWKGVLEAVDGESFTLAPARVDGEGQIVREDAPAAAIPFGKVRRASRIHIFIRPQKPGKGAKPGKARKSPAKEVR